VGLFPLNIYLRVPDILPDWVPG